MEIFDSSQYAFFISGVALESMAHGVRDSQCIIAPDQYGRFIGQPRSVVNSGQSALLHIVPTKLHGLVTISDEHYRYLVVDKATHEVKTGTKSPTDSTSLFEMYYEMQGHKIALFFKSVVYQRFLSAIPDSTGKVVLKVASDYETATPFLTAGMYYMSKDFIAIGM